MYFTQLIFVCSFTLDLSRKIPYFTMPEKERNEIWDDGTHFTPRGYDLVGTTIAGRIAELVREDGSVAIERKQEAEQMEL